MVQIGNNMVNFIKKYWLLLGLATLATLLVLFWIQGRPGKPKETLPNLPPLNYPALSGQNIPPQISFDSLQKENLPKQMSVYQTTSRSLDSSQAKTLAKNLGFPENPSNISTDTVFGDYYLWLSGPRSLSLRLSPVDINMVQDPAVSPPPQTGELPNEKSAQGFIESLLASNDLLPPQTGLKIESSRKIENDTILELQLTPTIGQTKIVDTNPITSLITAYLGKDGKIYSFLYKSGFTAPKNPLSYPTKNLDQIKQAVSKEGKIVVLGEPSSEPTLLVPNSVSIIRIEPVLLYYPQTPTILYPIYVLIGTAKTNFGDQPVYVYMPAVNSRYVQK